MLITQKLSLILLSSCIMVSCTSTTEPRVSHSVLTDTAQSVGSIQRHHGKTACQTNGNAAAWIFVDGTTPTVNRWFHLYATRGTTPISTDAPPVGAWVLGHNLLATPMSTPFAPGCLLLVEPITILPALPRAPNTPLPADQRIGAWLEGVHANLLIRPAPELLGHSVFVQYIMHAPGQNFLELLISSCIELEVGNE